MIAKVFEHPFDLTKVRLQSQVLDATARFNGPIDCLRQTFVKEGIRGLYRVCIASILVYSNYTNMGVKGSSGSNRRSYDRKRCLILLVQ